MKKHLRFLSLALTVLFLISCKNPGFSVKEKNNSGKTYISINVNGINSAKALYPTAELTSFTKITLKGKLGENETTVLKTWETEGSVNASDLMTADTSIALEKGNWKFTLVAENSSGLQYSGSLEKEIVKGPNSLSFVLKRVDLGFGTGDVNITLVYPETDGVSVTPRICTPTPHINDGKLSFTKLDGTGLVFEDNVLTVSDLTATDYVVEFIFYKNGIQDPLNIFRLYIEVGSGLTTSGTFTVNSLSDTYLLTKHSDGEAIINTYKENTTVELVDEELDGYTFDGWYSDSAYTTKITSVTMTEDKDVYAKWLKNISGGITFTPVESFSISAVDGDARTVESNCTLGTTDSITFSTGLDDDSYSYAWSVNGFPVEGAEDPSYTIENLSTYSGKYSVQCTVSNSNSKNSAGFLFNVVKTVNIVETGSRTVLYEKSNSKYEAVDSISTFQSFSENAFNCFDFTFDSEGNIYSSLYLDIKKIPVSGDSYSLSSEISNPIELTFDLENDTLFIVSQTDDYKLYKMENVSSISNGETGELVEITGFVSGISATPRISVFNDYLYVIYNGNDDFYLKKYKIEENNLEFQKSVSLKDILEEQITDYEYLYSKKVISFNDITANVDGVFILMKNENNIGTYNYPDSNVPAYSRGALIGFSSNLELNLIKGWSTDSAKYINTTDDDDGHNENPIKVYFPDKSNNNAFFGPTRFIAIKPKKLVFADDGVCIDMDEGTTFNEVLIQKNRVVEYNLVDNTFTATDDVKAEFEGQINIVSGTGFQSYGTISIKND